MKTVRAPVVALLYRPDRSDDSDLVTLLRDNRFRFIDVVDRSRAWLAYKDRVAGIIVVGGADPLAQLTFVELAEPTVPLFLITRSAAEGDVSFATNVAGTFRLPLMLRDRDALFSALSAHAGGMFASTHSELIFDPMTTCVIFRRRTLTLTGRQFALLHRLVCAGGQPVSRAALYRDVWERKPSRRDDRILTVYVFQLRAKLAQLGWRNSIQTVRGIGYQLREPGA